MCGIVGYLSKMPASKPVIQKMTDVLEHRGPDDQGTYIDGNLAIGHRRLSIIDLTHRGHQPMVSKCGRFVLSYNGEIYNFKELRKELAAHGYQFSSNSDTEVLMISLIHWGPQAIEKLNGMFAFAFWDKSERILLLARDRYGIKPLYISQHNNCFLFASENKAIMAHPEFNRSLDMKALKEYLTFQNILTDKTFLKDIRLMAAGTWMQVSENGDIFCEVRYWDYHFYEPDNPKTIAEYEEELDDLFKRAIERQLVADVQIGSYLSGGMDSGSISALSAKERNDLLTFTIGFDLNSISGLEISYDERQLAEYMSYLFQTEHYEMVLKAGDMQRCLPELVYALEEPRVGQSYPNFYASKLASKFVKVVMSGTGGDELFGGYPWRYYRAVVNDSFDAYVDKYYDFWQRLLPSDKLEKILNPISDHLQNIDTKEIFRNVFLHHSNELKTSEDYINHSLYFEAKTFLHGLLNVDDKLSMRHSLETRVPFLDNDLVDFAMKLPVSVKLKNLQKIVSYNENEPGRKTSRYFKKTNDGKIILRKVMERYISSDITNAVKQGFSAPDASWFRGESIDYVKDVLLNNNANIYNIMDKNIVQNILVEHFEGKDNKRLFIWSLLYIEEWLKQVNPSV